MPQTVPSESTTGMPGSWCSRKAATTSCTDVSGATVTGSVSMISLTSSATGATLQKGQAVRERLDHVTGHHVVRADQLRGMPSGEHVRERAQRRRLERAHSLREERADQA